MNEVLNDNVPTLLNRFYHEEVFVLSKCFFLNVIGIFFLEVILQESDVD